MTLVLTGPASVWHDSLYVLWPVIGAVVFVRGLPCDAIAPPLAVTGPSVVLGPVNVQLVTPVAYHERVLVLPECTREGDATSETLGLIAVTVTLFWVVVWSHTTVYTVVALTVTFVELLAEPPVEKFEPEADVFGAGHAQVIVVWSPVNTVGGSAVIVGVGQLELDGADAEQVPAQVMVPEFVWPQAFAEEVQALP